MKFHLLSFVKSKAGLMGYMDLLPVLSLAPGCCSECGKLGSYLVRFGWLIWHCSFVIEFDLHSH